MQKARGHSGLGGLRPYDRSFSAIELPPLVSTWFQVLVTPLIGVLFTFQSPYYCTIGRQGILRLGRWSSRIHTGFHVSGATQGTSQVASTTHTGLSPSVVRRSNRFRFVSTTITPALQPRLPRDNRFGLFRFRSPLLTESLLLSFPVGTEMFHFPTFAPYAYVFSAR